MKLSEFLEKYSKLVYRHIELTYHGVPHHILHEVDGKPTIRKVP